MQVAQLEASTCCFATYDAFAFSFIFDALYQILEFGFEQLLALLDEMVQLVCLRLKQVLLPIHHPLYLQLNFLRHQELRP